MKNIHAYILKLSEKASKLRSSEAFLFEENKKLKKNVEYLESKLADQKNILQQLEEQNKVVKIAKSVSTDEDDRKEQKRKLNELVREVDKCIALLNS